MRVYAVTYKCFWDDPYQTTLTTTITAIEAHNVRVAATMFYAFSGDQERGIGTIAGRTV